MAEPPGAIDKDSIELQRENIERVSDIKTQYEISFALNWKPPLLRYGGYRYEIYVGDRHVLDEGSINNPFKYAVVRKLHLCD